MRTTRMLARLFAVGSAGTALLVFNPVTAGAATNPNTPQTSPRWQTDHVQQIRDAGSDTTFFMMQKIADLYEQAGLYGCALGSDNATCNPTSDPSTTDYEDNYDRVEVTTGVDAIGSSAGIGQLCGTTVTPFTVDFARSSRALKSTDCATAAGLGYAKDGVPTVDFQTVDPTALGTGSSYGDVAAGWRPGDPNNCAVLPAPGPSHNNGVNGCSGIPFTNMTNNDNGGGINSLAYRIYCQTGGSQITDWGQLTDPNAAVGAGAPIGVPIIVMGVNPSSGTTSTYTGFAASGVTSPSCNVNANAASNHIALENNAAQIADFLNADNPGNTVAQAQELGQVLYFMSNGVYNTNAHAKTVTITGTTSSFPASKLKENGISAGTSTDLNNTFPTARTLYNVYRTDTVRGSTAGFLNWICDQNSAFQKGTDLNTGINYDTELSSLISTTFGFPRLTDTSAAPNNSCQLITTVANPSS